MNSSATTFDSRRPADSQHSELMPRQLTPEERAVIRRTEEEGRRECENVRETPASRRRAGVAALAVIVVVFVLFAFVAYLIVGATV